MVLLILIHLFLLINLRFEAWPEMLTYPYLMNHGFQLYRDIINPYPPLFNWFLSGFFSVFGLSLLNLKLLTWSIIALIDLLIYFIAKKLYGQKAALIALGFFILFQPLLDGNGLWYDLALTPLLLLAFYFRKPVFLSLAFFVKQSALFLFPLLFNKRLLISFLLLFAISYLPFAVRGNSADYLFWSWRYVFTLFPFLPGYKDLGSLRLWLLAAIPFIPLVLANNKKPLLWVILSFLFIFPRFGLFHLQPALAFAALSLRRVKINRLLVTGYLLLVTVLWARHIKLFWHQPDRFFEPEVIDTASQLTKHTDPSDKLLFLNVPNQYFVLANRLPVKPWADTFSWYLEVPGVQEKIIAVPADKVILSPYQSQGKFIPGSYIPQIIDQFVKNNYSQAVSLNTNVSIYHHSGL